jgi:hypothetical protein
MINGWTASVDKMNSVDQGVYDWQRHRWHQSSPKVAENTDGNTTAGDWDYSVPNDNSTTPQAESITEDPQFQKTVQEKAAALAKQEADARKAAAEIRSIISDDTNVDSQYETANDNFKDAPAVPAPAIIGLDAWNEIKALKDQLTQRVLANAQSNDDSSSGSESDSSPAGSRWDDLGMYTKYVAAVWRAVAGDLSHAWDVGSQAFIDRLNEMRMQDATKQLSSPDVYDTSNPAASPP